MGRPMKTPPRKELDSGTRGTDDPRRNQPSTKDSRRKSLYDRGLPQQRLHDTVSLNQRSVQRSRIFAAGFGQIRTPATFAANLPRDGADDFSRLNAAGEVLGDADDQRDVAIRCRAQHDDSRAELIAQLIDQRAHLGALQIVHAVSQYLDAPNLFNFFVDVGCARGCRLHPRLIEFARQALDFSVFLFELGSKRSGGRRRFLSDSGGPILSRFVRKGGAREACDHGFEFVILAEVAQRAFSRHGLDAPHARRNTSLFQNLDQPDLAGSAGMCAAAEFRRKIADLDYAHLVAVLFAKQRHGVILVDRHVNRNVLDDLDPFVAQNFLVDDVFDVLQLFVGDSGEVREIEAQMVGGNQRPRLLDVLA